MARIPAHNPLTTPVVIDAEGRQLGGGEWGTVDDEAAEVTAAVDQDRLLTFPDGLGDDADPAIVAAVSGPVAEDLPDASPAPGDDADEPKPASTRRSRS